MGCRRITDVYNIKNNIPVEINNLTMHHTQTDMGIEYKEYIKATFPNVKYAVFYDSIFMKQLEVDTIFGIQYEDIGYRLVQNAHYYKNREDAIRDVMLRKKITNKHYFNIFAVELDL